VNHRPDIERYEGSERFDVLSSDEEIALCAIRDAVDRIRISGRVAALETVEGVLLEFGASKEGDADAGEIKVFKLYGAHFSLLPSPLRNDGIEVKFGTNRK